MWPGEQPPGGEQNPQDQHQNPYQQPGYQQPNPYQQPGYQQQPNPYGQPPNTAQQPNPYGQPPNTTPQPNPYGQPPNAGQQPNPYGQPPNTAQQPNPYAQQSGSAQQPWASPTVPMGAGSPQPPRDNRKRTMITALIAAAAVVVAAGVTGFLVLSGDGHDDDKGEAKPAPSKPRASASQSPGGDDNPRGTQGAQPTVPGWKVVVNPKWGTAFDVPADWQVKSPDLFIGFEDDSKTDGSVLIGMSAPAIDKEKWCSSDDDHDGTTDDTSLGAAGTKGQNGAKDTASVAENDSAWWVFGGYTDQKEASKKLLKLGKAKDFTTASGVKGSVATAYSSGVPKKGKCDSDGKATTFAFKNSKGDFVSWTFYGAKGVSGEVPDATVQKILKTVRLNGDPTG